MELIKVGIKREMRGLLEKIVKFAEIKKQGGDLLGAVEGNWLQFWMEEILTKRFNHKIYAGDVYFSRCKAIKKELESVFESYFSSGSGYCWMSGNEELGRLAESLKTSTKKKVLEEELSGYDCYVLAEGDWWK